MSNNNSQGYIATIAVLGLAATSVVLVISTSFAAFRLADRQLSLQDSVAATAYATTCAEYALTTLLSDVGYSGGDSVEVNGNTCDVVIVTGSGAQDRTIQTKSTVGSVTRRLEVVVATLGPTVRISSWQPVTTF